MSIRKHRFLVSMTLVFALAALVPGLAFSARSVESCDEPYDTDIRAVLYQIGNKWSSYESYVTSYTGYSNLSTCLENRFKSNGKVKCKDLSDGTVGKATPGFKTIKIDEDWLDSLPSTQKNRRACIAALMAHEYSHTCFASESRADNIDEATFYWWKDEFGATNSWSSCGISG